MNHGDAMKTSNRLLLGVLFSLLFSVGLVRAAGHLDPVNHSSPDLKQDADCKGTLGCSDFCDISEDEGQVTPQ